MPYEFGDVVLVRFPFTNQIASKQRPAVVVSNRSSNMSRPDLVIMPITSQLRSQSIPGEVWIREWQSAHLLKPSAIKPIFATIEQGVILKMLGVLHLADQQALREANVAVLG
jgi:mRNA interferase MazF